MEVIGMLETRGLQAAIEAADAMVKAANVRLLDKKDTGGGLITVLITGDADAVRDAVNAGEAAVRRVGTVISTHVIPRPHGELSVLPGPKRLRHSEKESGGTAVDPRPGETHLPTPLSPPSAEAPSLEDMKITELRSYLRRLPMNPLAPGEILYANRERLMQAIHTALQDEQGNA